MAPAAYDLVAMGRVGVDIYPLDARRRASRTCGRFEKFLGGSATNVAVAAARYGRRVRAHHPHRAATRSAATSTRRCAASASTTRSSRAVDGPPTPVTFCEVFPPDDFPLYFYRYPTAPDLHDRGRTSCRSTRSATRGVYWATVTGLSQEPRRAAHFARLGGPRPAHAHRPRPRLPADVLGRPRARRASRSARPSSTSPWPSATARSARSPSARPTRSAPPTPCSSAGVELAIVKQGPKGVLAATARRAGRGAALPRRGRQRPRRRRRLRRRARATGCSRGWDLRRVLEFANVAGAIVAGELECSTAMPTEAEVERAPSPAGRTRRRGGTMTPRARRAVPDASPT